MKSSRSVILIVAFVGALAFGGSSAYGQFSPVYNGSFEKGAADGRAPDGWQAAGNKAIVQKLAREKDPERGYAAKLTCTRFVPGKHDSQVMMAQFGHVGVEKDKWYRVSLWARSADLEAGVAQVQLVSVRTWWPFLLSQTFVPGRAWKRFEFVFRSKDNLKAADSRFSVYFAGTGTLYVSDVSIEETQAPQRQWLPAIPMPAAGNALPNSSFECGGEGWGCSASAYFGYQANVFRLVGKWDRTQAYDGSASWKVTLSDAHPLMLYVDYSPPVAKPVRSLVFAHAGWVKVQPGQPYTFSAYVRCDRPGTQVRVGLKEAGGDWHLAAWRGTSVGREWKRLQVTYTPKGEYLSGCLVLALPGKQAQNEERTFWIDAVQFERGSTASAYHPRSPVEAEVTTAAPGNILTDPAGGLRFRLVAHNASDRSQALEGRLSATDFWDRTVWQEDVRTTLGPGQTTEKPYAVLAGRRGFFRLRWQPDDGPAESIRCAVIDPYREKDSIFGFNHSFPEDFVFPLAQEGGLRWWRDWTDVWNNVQPRAGAPFDFSMVDVQDERVLKAGGNLLVLLPSPSADWASSARPGQKWADSHMPKDLKDYAAYVRATVKHFQGRTGYFEVINEPGYILSPSAYVKLLKTAYEAAKEANPKCTVIGGLAGDPASDWLDQFVKLGGLRYCDVTNYHMYPGRERAESRESSFANRWEQMQKLGEAKPIWVTEFGVYAEDDPVTLPLSTGDETMNQTLRPNELTASRDIVQLATVMFAHGVRKVFFHMGLCAGLNGSSMDNVFFEYGGAPRKMYPAIAEMGRLLGPDFRFVRKWTEPAWLCAYEFQAAGRTVVVLWTRKTDAPPLAVPAGLQALDLMGNPLPQGPLVPGEVPIYLVGPSGKQVQ